MKSIIRIGLLTAVIAVTAVASAQKVRYAMRIDGLGAPGSSFPVLSFSWGASNPVAFTPGGGMSAGKVSISSVNIMRGFDNLSPALFLACASGQHYQVARLQGFLGDATVPFMEIRMEDVFVESIQHSGSQGSALIESVSFTSQKLFLNAVQISQDPEVSVALDEKIAMLIEKASQPAKKAAVTVL